MAGIPAALLAALLFGAGTPLAKLLLAQASPWMLAGVLYVGSGIGLLLFRLTRNRTRSPIPRRDIPWLAGAIAFGGVLGPVLLMWGLSHTTASSASLLLNAEGVLTALVAWFVFRENFDRRIAAGMLCIVAGGVVLSWPSDAGIAPALPSLAIVGACLAWAIDNNLTRKVALADATFIAMTKGLAAGSVNVSIALAMGEAFPSADTALSAAALGFVSYGLSLVLFVRALRDLGAARTGAYFAVAPFAGAILSVLLLDDAIGARLLIAASLMAIGVWLHLTEHHLHRHRHDTQDHDHEHEHDEHHRHGHEGLAPGERHSHPHHHEPLSHSHEHFPDSHHRHGHEHRHS
jgi:drug/metabolite transporter (DMT)-like permease